MTLSAASPEDVVNIALARIGYKQYIANIFEGSPAADAALDVYAQTRDELLRDGEWGFAQSNIVLILLKQAPVGGYSPPVAWDPTINPPPPWTYEYAYPSDCLKLRNVKSSPLFVRNYDPQPRGFAVEYDATIPGKAIMTNVAAAIGVYTAQVTSPLLWEADFIEAVAAALGRRLAPVLMGMDAVKLAAADEAAETVQSESTQG